MTVTPLAIPEVQLIQQPRFNDHRGSFIKTFHHSSLQAFGIDFELRESFYSTSAQHVIRGMHFQVPPMDHAKIVFCTDGAILDVAVDLRKQSPTYGQYVTAELSADNHRALYIPKGFAHGFLSLTGSSTAFYLVSSEHSPEHDRGILFNSFGLDWQVANPILSARDLAFPSLADFDSPF
jgi:dTDP-4-dehydrorhamnose 3,5-epimerase